MLRQRVSCWQLAEDMCWRYMTVEEAAMMYYGEGPDGMDYDMGWELGAVIFAYFLHIFVDFDCFCR